MRAPESGPETHRKVRLGPEPEDEEEEEEEEEAAAGSGSSMGSISMGCRSTLSDSDSEESNISTISRLAAALLGRFFSTEEALDLLPVPPLFGAAARLCQM